MTVLPADLPLTAAPLPGWYDEVAGAALHRAHLVLSGNLRDLYPHSKTGYTQVLPFEDVLWALLRDQGFEGLVLYDPVEGARLHPAMPPDVVQRAQAAGVVPERGNAARLRLPEVQARLVACQSLRLALVVSYASHILSHAPASRDGLFVAVDRAARLPDGTRPSGAALHVAHNPTLWLVDQPADLPDWFLIGNDLVREIRIDLPDLEERFAFARTLAGHFRSDGSDTRTGLEAFALRSDGETLRAMAAMADVARGEGHGLSQLSDTLRLYRTGVRRNPWTSPVLRTRLASGHSHLSARVKGQARAVDKTLDILMRAVMGLSGAQTGQRHARPRGVLFFAGPTGVGKTELAKAVTELIFGDAQACHRFDMSEFMEEKSVTRLIGAPPGEPGHDRGGELTNAIRRRPFSVFLFDEIEKAHPRILDTFLQILDEGRLTDARGAVAHFADTLIIFTSNIGTFGGAQAMNGGMNILPSDTYRELAQKVNTAVQTHFRFGIKRPELMNRIGQNIVAFDFLDHPSVSAIFDALIARVKQAVLAEHGVRIRIGAQALDRLKVLCTHDVFDGGRGVGNRVETHFINPLARALFQHAPAELLWVSEVTAEDEAGMTRLVLSREDPDLT